MRAREDIGNGSKTGGSYGMNEQRLTGIADLAGRYDTFIFDLWGVLHNGLEAYPDALDCLRRLRAMGRNVALLSNAPRPGVVVAREMARLGITEDAYDTLLTSGDAAIAGYNSDARTAGRPYYHLGPERNQPTVDGCRGEPRPIEQAETIICTGPFDDETETAADYADMFAEAVARKVVMVCANPDIIVMRGEKLIPCAGALAEAYEEAGGLALRYGKPYTAVYDMLLERLPAAERERTLMLGDGFPTDIRGAAAAGIDALLVAHGIHAEEIALRDDGTFDAEALQRLAGRYDVPVPAVIDRLRW